MKREDAESLGTQARKKDVLLSMHGSYYVNCCGAKKVREASKRRLVACANAAKWMGANVVVFHTGSYGRLEKNYAFRTCINTKTTNK